VVQRSLQVAGALVRQRQSSSCLGSADIAKRRCFSQVFNGAGKVLGALFQIPNVALGLVLAIKAALFEVNISLQSLLSRPDGAKAQ